MRGSPLIRFFLLTLALAATGTGLLRLTAARVAEKMPELPAISQAITTRSVPFRLLLSDPAEVVTLDSGRASPPLQLDMSPINGKLEMDSQNPHLSLVVRWKNPLTAGEHRFAKLTLEAPGQETFVHVFDAAGDIDDFLELPIPTMK
ncbi:MAG: hypothetical protein ABI600_19800 [Luteolibacter sp.]